MRNAYIRSFLILIILLQSLAAVADAHQFHQSNDQHDVVAEHVHDQSADDIANITGEHTESLDCHHCCHCHGFGYPALLASSSCVWLGNNPSAIFIYNSQNPSKINVSLYRPPIV